VLNELQKLTRIYCCVVFIDYRNICREVSDVNNIFFCSNNLKGRRRLVELRVDKRITFSCIFKTERDRVSFDWQQVRVAYLRVTLFNKNQANLRFPKSRTGSHVTYSCHHNSSLLLSPYLCIRGVFLSSIHYNQSLRVYINGRHQYIRLICKLKRELTFWHRNLTFKF
jgi:hypothetical protein